MSQSANVDPAALRASVGPCDGIARTMKGPADKAVKETGTAASSLTGWSIGPALTEIATSWKPAPDGLHARLHAGGQPSGPRRTAMSGTTSDLPGLREDRHRHRDTDHSR